MRWGLMIGLVMLGASILLFLIAVPRRGQVVSFLRGRDFLQTVYTMVLIALFVVGGAISINSWN
jgi:hypothetical protein